MTHKRFIPFLVVLVILLGFLSLYIDGYRLTPLAAAKSHPFVRKDLTPVQEIKFDWGTAFIFRDGNYGRTVLAEKAGVVWRRSSAAVGNDNILDQDDGVKTLGWGSYSSKNGKVTLIAVESLDPKVAFIEAGPNRPETERIRKKTAPGETVIFVWDKFLSLTEIAPLALSADGKPLYRFGFPEGPVINFTELRWYQIEEVSENILEGYKLSDLGLSIELDNLNPFSDPNYIRPYEPSYEVWYTNSNEYHSFSSVGDEKADISVLAIRYTDNKISMEFMPALYLQGFKKPGATEQFIEVRSKLYSITDLDQYKLYEDEKYIVFDIRDLLPIQSFTEQIERISEVNQANYDYDWLIEVYDYLKSYKNISIKQI